VEDENDSSRPQRVFGLSDDEILVEDYSCACQSQNDKMVRHGRLYIFLNYVCFWSNIIGNYKQVVPFVDIEEISRHNTALVFPNAIKVEARKSTLYFTSLFFRENCFKIMRQVWNDSKRGRNAMALMTPGRGAFSTMPNMRRKDATTTVPTAATDSNRSPSPRARTRHTVQLPRTPQPVATAWSTGPRFVPSTPQARRRPSYFRNTTAGATVAADSADFDAAAVSSADAAPANVRLQLPRAPGTHSRSTPDLSDVIDLASLPADDPLGPRVPSPRIRSPSASPPPRRVDALSVTGTAARRSRSNSTSGVLESPVRSSDLSLSPSPQRPGDLSSIPIDRRLLLDEEEGEAERPRRVRSMAGAVPSLVDPYRRMDLESLSSEQEGHPASRLAASFSAEPSGEELSGSAESTLSGKQPSCENFLDIEPDLSGIEELAVPPVGVRCSHSCRDRNKLFEGRAPELEVVLPVNLKKFYVRFLSERYNYWTYYHQLLDGFSDIQLTVWHKDDCCFRRFAQYTRHVQSPFTPSSIDVTITQRVRFRSSNCLVYTSEANSLDNPYGSSFTMDTRWEVTEPKDDMKHVVVKIWFAVHWVMDPPRLLRAVVEQSMLDYQRAYFPVWMKEASNVIHREATLLQYSRTAASMAASEKKPPRLPAVVAAHRVRPQSAPPLGGGEDAAGDSRPPQDPAALPSQSATCSDAAVAEPTPEKSAAAALPPAPSLFGVALDTLSEGVSKLLMPSSKPPAPGATTQAYLLLAFLILLLLPCTLLAYGEVSWRLRYMQTLSEAVAYVDTQLDVSQMAAMQLSSRLSKMSTLPLSVNAPLLDHYRRWRALSLPAVLQQTSAQLQATEQHFLQAHAAYDVVRRGWDAISAGAEAGAGVHALGGGWLWFSLWTLCCGAALLFGVRFLLSMKLTRS